MTAQRRILILDNDRDFREVVKFRLEAQGYQAAFGSADEPDWGPLKKFSPDLIIFDPRLFKIDGVSLINKIKNTPGWEKIQIAVLVSDKKEKDKFSAAGAAAVLVKPVEITDLMNKIADLLVKKQYEELIKNEKNSDR